MYNPYQDILKLKKQIKWLKEKFECQLTNKCCDDNNDTPSFDVIERTSQLINDGENGLQPFIVDTELSDKIINGNVFWLQSGLTFQSTNPITYRLAGTVFQAPEKTFVLDSSDPVLSRIDVFAVNLQGEVVVVKGEPSLDPQEPAIDFGSQLRINAKEGYSILDTHFGSGSIAVALDSVNKIEKMNLTLTACEIEKDYFKDAVNRIEEETKWESLF